MTRSHSLSGRSRLGALAATAIVVLVAAVMLVAGAGATMASSARSADDEGGRITTSGGSVVVPFDATGPFDAPAASKRLPLTRVTISGRLQVLVPPPQFGMPPQVLARVSLEAADGRTFDVFAPGSQASSGALAASSYLLTTPIAAVSSTESGKRFGSVTLITTSHRATATITIGAAIDLDADTCTFLWQAVESRNGDSDD
jgi:hypothetical protein